MTDRLKDKIDELEIYLQQLSEMLPESYDEYSENFEKRAACERYFEKIIEAVVDLAFLVIKEKKLRNPEDDESSFFILAEGEIISDELAERLKDAKGMRNILAHEYGRVNDELVFHALTEELEADVRDFIKFIKEIK